MALNIQHGIPFLILCVLVRGQVLPNITESYTAIGEISIVVEDFGNITILLRFEENYDFEGQRASFEIMQISQMKSFVEYFDSRQTFQYSDEGCQVYTPEEWVSIGSPPDIKPYETDHGNIIFPLKQLVNLTSSTLINPVGNSTFYREVPAYLYEHRITFDFEDTTTTLDIDAYWSNGEWNTSSRDNIVPLGFFIRRATYNKTTQETERENQYVNIFYFSHGAVDLDTFKVREGITCTGIKPTYPFPNPENFSVFSYSTEFSLGGYRSVSTVDTWWDSRNRLLRIDFDPLRQPNPTSKTEYSVSDIITHSQGAVYRITDAGDKCSVMSLDDYVFDPQHIIDVRSEGTWDKPDFFGLEETSMIYIGDTIKRGIPCSIWQGERLDWPSISRPTTTIWEWCIANAKKREVKGPEFLLVNLEITIKENPNEVPILKEGTKMTYGFYNVRIQSPGSMEALAFDLFPCFLDNHIRLMFAVNYNSSFEEYLKKIVSNPEFLALWKAEINHAAGLLPTSLRVGQLRTMLYGKNMAVKFTLLGIHEKLSAETKGNEKPLGTARRSLEKVINDGKLATEWMVSENDTGRFFTKLSMKAVPYSLTEEESTLFPESTDSSVSTGKDETTDHPTTSSGKPTQSPSIESTPTDSITEISTDTENPIIINSTTPGLDSSTSETQNPGQKNKRTSYSPGIMALVAIIMIFVGMGIGASGTYFKIKRM